MPKSRKGWVAYVQARRRWKGRYDPIDPQTGKRTSIIVYRETKVEAARDLEEKIRLWESGSQIKDQGMTVGQLADLFASKRLIAAEYLGEKKIAGRRQLTSPNGWLNQIRHFLGAKRVQSLRLADLEEFKRWLAALPSRSRITYENGKTTLVTKKDGPQRGIEAVNRVLELLRTMMAFAVANHILEEGKNPFRHAKGLIERSAEKRSERFPTMAEEMRLLEHCVDDREHLRSVLIVAADTGLRQNERRTLAIADVDFEAGLIKVRQINAKANKAREIPMTARVRQELARLAKDNRKSGLIFGGVLENRKSFRTACRNAGIEGLDLHDFRHRFVTVAFLADCPREAVLKASGHSSDEYKRYINVTPEQLLALLNPLEGQTGEDVEQYALERMRELRDALGYSKIASLLQRLSEKL